MSTNPCMTQDFGRAIQKSFYSHDWVIHSTHTRRCPFKGNGHHKVYCSLVLFLLLLPISPSPIHHHHHVPYECQIPGNRHFPLLCTWFIPHDQFFLIIWTDSAMCHMQIPKVIDHTAHPPSHLLLPGTIISTQSLLLLLQLWWLWRASTK